MRIDLYCERTDWSFWSEPLNALTNLAFLLAAILIARRLRREQGTVAWDAALLAALAALVGIGSFLFHTFATVWAHSLDLGFIAAFIYVFVARFLTRVAGLGWFGVLVGLAVYFALERGMRAALPPDALSGSAMYLPALLALTAFTAYAWRQSDPAAPRLGVAVAVLVVALALRTIDQAVCATWPAGTHFLWHLLVAWGLYLAATALLAPRRKAGTGNRSG
jgi:hypothetical protein